ncbi:MULTISPECIES: hypothetical protein [Streptomyces]|uniref:hypothetical protein n=1 Tax=Streptomyces TaxID=1883 RepID=UPI00403C5C5E
MKDDFAQIAGSTAGTVAKFAKDTSGIWGFHEMVRGFDSEPVVFSAEMGSAPQL